MQANPGKEEKLRRGGGEGCFEIVVREIEKYQIRGQVYWWTHIA